MRGRGYPWLEIVLLAVLAAFLLLGAAGVPFHPDETSWLFQTRDLEAVLSRPLALAWRDGAPPTPELTYRLLNAPLAKYILGTARWAAGVPAGSVENDWAWSNSWDENVAAGALPAEGLLAAARLASALLLIPAVVALYFCGRALGGRGTALAAAIFLATHALVLLHGRRAMAEGALIFAICLALLGLLYADRHPWLAGLAAGLAFAAKTSAAVWIPLGWIAAAWSVEAESRSRRAMLGRLGAFTLAAALLTLMLYPVLWAEPAGALIEMWRARQALVSAQVAATGQVMPWAVLSSPGERAATLLAHLYFSPPQFAEAANYLRQTASAEAAYLAVPGHSLLRGLAGGALMLTLTLVGIVRGIRRERTSEAKTRRATGMILLATAVQAAVLVLAVPLAFQRYTMPLVPLVCLWAGHGLAGLVEALARNRRPVAEPAASGGE
jgi:4-amino-4-deoxy-L-arabinose transferase-like glycosyltransferase